MIPTDRMVCASLRVRFALAALVLLALSSMVTAIGVRADGMPARVADSTAAARPAAPRPTRPPPEASLQLRWREPYGYPRATDRLMTDCADTSRVDTLFVTFEVPVFTQKVESLEVVVYFQPLGRDSLGPFWHFKRGWENQFNLEVDFESYLAGVEGEVPWPASGYELTRGQGKVSYDHRSGRGRLDLGFYVPRNAGKPLLPHTTYTCARIRIRHSRSDLVGCMQPLCIEAADLALKFGTRRHIRSGPGDQRFVTWNAREGTACVPSITSRTVRPWHPK